MKFKNIMIDIEAFGTKSNAPIVEIGAVAFDDCRDDRQEFHAEVDIESAVTGGAVIDASTVKFWFDLAVKGLPVPGLKDSAIGIVAALAELQWFIREHCTDDVQVWANSPSYDCAILKKSFESWGLDVPWEFWNERDVRTIVDVGRRFYKIDPKKTIINANPHSALSDAHHQVDYLLAIFNAMNPIKYVK